ncbi:unnamed protein product, partial [Notodromas monacha]
FFLLRIFAGQFLLESSRYDEAAAEYETAAELAPDDVDAVLNAANALRQAGINSKAEKFYRRAVLLQPNITIKSDQGSLLSTGDS